MSEQNNIDDLFRKSFEDFEADVNPNVWQHIESRINPSSGVGQDAVSNSANNVSMATSLSIGKIVGIIAIMISTASLGIWIYHNQDEKAGNKQAVQVISEAKDNKNIPVSSGNKQSSPPVAYQPFVGKNKQTKSNSKKLLEQNLAAEFTSKSNAKLPGQKESNGTSVVIPGKGVLPENTTIPTNEPSISPTNNNIGTKGGVVSYNTYENISSDTDGASAINGVQAIIIANPPTGYAPLKVAFSSKNIATDYEWNFGDGATSDAANPSHSYEEYGTYIVTLTLKDSDGNTTTGNVTIQIWDSSPEITIPNIFTPNYDGYNDVFTIKSKNIILVEGLILDRNSNTVYAWNTTEDGWDGNNLKGEPMPKGTYFYVITATGRDDKQYEYKGSVTLMR